MSSASGGEATQSELASAAPAELSGSTQPSGLLRTLGGQTGSEISQGLEECAPLRSEYSLSSPTPLGFSAAELIEALGARDYWLSGLGLGTAPVQVSLQLTGAATFIDRDPSASPELECVDVVRVSASFRLSAPERETISFQLQLYADAPARFAGLVSLGASEVQGTLAAAAPGSELVIEVESADAGVRLWFYRIVNATERELIGRVVPVP
jgi:hypothetical protein